MVYKQLNTPTGIKNSHEVADMPPHAVQVFDGELFNVYQWHQEMFDGTTQVFERVSRKDGVSVIAVTGDKRIIICHEEQPNRNAFITLPHGGVEIGDEPLETGKRELLEETGYVGEEWSLLFTHIGADKVNEKFYVYRVVNVKRLEDPKCDAGEKIEVKELTFDELCDVVLLPEFRGKNIALHIATMLAQGKKEELRTLLLG